MCRRFYLFLFLSAFLCFNLSAQTPTEPQFGRIPDSLFAAERYPVDTDVPFIYSLKQLDINFENEQESIVAVLNYHVRIKVFDATAQGARVVGIPYYFENNIESVSNIRAATYGSPESAVPVSAENIRTINVNSRYNVKEFTMPAVEDGSVIEYRYTIRRRYIEELPDFYLSHQVPTEWAEVSITYPKYLRYSGAAENFDGTINHFITQLSSSTVPKVFTYPQPDPIIKETWRARNIPAVQKETYISSLDDYRGKLKFQLSAFGLPRQTLENSWNYVVAELRREQQILAFINANEVAKKRGQEIGDAFASKEAVQDSIFRYVNENTRFSGSKSPFSSVKDSVVLRGDPVDQAAINQTLAAMLNGAGIDAYPVLISTRESGMINTSFPSFFEFNGQLIHTEINGTSYFMDASFSHSQPNLIPVNTFNETGLLIRPKSHRWVDLKPDRSLFSIDVDIDAALDRQGNLQGRLQSHIVGYPAQKIRQLKAEGTPVSQIIKEAVLDGYPQVELSNASLQNLHDYNAPIRLAADFTLEDYAVSYTDGLEFSPMVVGYLRNNPFDENQRNLPVTLDAPERLNLQYNISLPEGMALPAVPNDRTIQLPGASFSEQYNMGSNALRYQFNIDISRKTFSTDVYPRLLNFYERWVHLSNSSWLIES
jgi:hypothetical protein